MVDCCKDEKYNLLLKFELGQDTEPIKNGLMSVMNWSEAKSKAAIEFAKLQGQFLLTSAPLEQLVKLNQRLAENNVPFKLIKSKK